MSKWNAEKCWRWCATCSPDSLEDCKKCWEKTARKEGCEYCATGVFGPVIHLGPNGALTQMRPEFCPKCGRPLKEVDHD